jgi:hypothetical protein
MELLIEWHDAVAEEIKCVALDCKPFAHPLHLSSRRVVATQAATSL